MGSHKQRIKRKIKKEIKRKVQRAKQSQASTNTQRASPGQKVRPGEDMLKTMMLLMNGNKQSLPPNDFLNTKEVAAKMKNEQERQKLEYEKEMKRLKDENDEMKLKAKAAEMNKNVEHQKQKNEVGKEIIDTEAKQNELKRQKELQELNAKAREKKRTYSFDEQHIQLQLETQGYTNELLDKDDEVARLANQHTLNNERIEQQKKKYEIEKLESERDRLLDLLSKDKTMIEKYMKLTNRDNKYLQHVLDGLNQFSEYLANDLLDNLVELADAKDRAVELKGNTVFYLKEAQRANTQLLKDLKKEKGKYNYLSDLDDKTHELKHENKDLAREVDVLNHSINLILHDTRISHSTQMPDSTRAPPGSPIRSDEVLKSKARPNKDVIEYKHVGKDGKEYWVAEDKVDFDNPELVKRDIDKEYAEMLVENKKLNTLKKQVDANYERMEKEILETDRLNDERERTYAYNEALDDVALKEDNLQRIAQLTVDIENLKQQINDKNTSKADVMKFNRELVELERKKDILEAQNSKLSSSPVSKEKIQRHAELQHENDNLTRQIEVKNKQKRLKNDLEDDITKREFENNVKSAVLDADDNKDVEDATKDAINKNVEVKQKQELLTQKGKVKDSERELKMAQMTENALHSDKVKETQEKINEQIKQQAMYDEQRKQQEELYNTKKQAARTQATFEAQKQMNQHFDETQGTIDAQTMITVANDKINKEMNKMSEEEKYVAASNARFRANFSQDAPLLFNVRQIMNRYLADIDSPDWYEKNLTTREQVDAFDNLVENVINKGYDKEKETWNLDNISNDDEDVVNYMDIIFPPTRG